MRRSSFWTGRETREGLLRKQRTEPQSLEHRDGRFYYADGKEAGAQEVLYHYFNIPIPVIAEPVGWYAYHRKPSIVEFNAVRDRVLVDFSAYSWRGDAFGGRCLYAMVDTKWGAYTIRPNRSESIATAEEWLEKRGWEGWDL